MKADSKQNISIIAQYSVRALLTMFFWVYENETAREAQNRSGGFLQNDTGFRLVHLRYSRIAWAIQHEQKVLPDNRGGLTIFGEDGKITPEILQDLRKCVVLYSRQVEARAKLENYSFTLPSAPGE
jgi:hypothetical protein